MSSYTFSARSFCALAVGSACLVAASVASGQQLPETENGLTVRGTAPFGDEGPVLWSLASVHVTGQTLTLTMLDVSGAEAGDVTVSPWPFKKAPHGGLAVGLTKRRIQAGSISVTGSRTLQPFGAVLRLAVQQRSDRLPAMVIQTRARSGQVVVPGWRAVYAESRWLIQRESMQPESAKRASLAPPQLDALAPQRLRSQGRDWCVTSFARAERRESPPLLDWIAVAAPDKGRCPK